MPTLLPLLPAKSGYSVGERPGAVLRAPLEGGRSRMRRDMLDPAPIVSVQWNLTARKYDQLQAFHRHATRRGADPFLIDLVIDEAALVRHTARFVPDSFRLAGIEGGKYIVQAQLEAEPTAGDTSALDEALVMMFGVYGSGDAVYAAMKALEQLVNEDLAI